MKTVRVITALCLWFLACTAKAVQQNPDSIFKHFFENAQTFADTYPREKAYLHFDNTSYCIGDTIWFKAYVTLAEGNIPSIISKPLYVELLDQSGNLIEKQTIELEEGEGHGQIALKPSYLTGYYEIRAYTRWMQAFEEKECFSRTFPIYQRVQDNGNTIRKIETYNLDQSMTQRPKSKEKALNLRFFPEGGTLVQGIESLIAFEVVSSEEGPVSVEGVVSDKEGTVLTRFRATHSGIGYFAHTPQEKPATVRLEYKGETYSFPLPEALSRGYVLHVRSNNDSLNIQVARSSIALSDTLALFVSQQGRPRTYKRLNFKDAQTTRLIVPTQKLAEGVTQISLINAKGETLCERLYYVIQDSTNSLHIESSLQQTTKYQPYASVKCQLTVKDKDGKPVSTRLSVAVRDAVNSDYIEYDHNIYTDQLLTSELKGYIHQPGYYFASRSPQRLHDLDALMMVRGWKKYNMSQIMGADRLKLAYMPERMLIIRGMITTTVRQKAREDMEVTVFINNKPFPMTGITTTDGLGYFDIPMEDLYGNNTALIQTKKKDKKNNTETKIRLLRDYSPPLRDLEYSELHPKYISKDSLKAWSIRADSLYEDSILRLEGVHLLKEVLIKSKKRKSNYSDKFRQSLNAYYNVPYLLDKFRDEGKEVNDLFTLLNLLNKNIILRRSVVYTDPWKNSKKPPTPNLVMEIHGLQEEDKEKMDEKNVISAMQNAATYNSSPMLYLINNELITIEERELFIENDVDAIQYIELGSGMGISDRIDKKKSKVLLSNYKLLNEKYFDKVRGVHNYKTDRQGQNAQEANGDWTNHVSNAVACYITTIEGWKRDKKIQGSWGVRRTMLQGYSQPLEFYSPVYNTLKRLPENDYRRTLYWNPNLETNENGTAVIECYNSKNSAILTISAETIHNGQPGVIIK